jgi:hypothetical protein
VPLEIQEHRGHPGWCSHCRKQFEAPLPIGIERGGLVRRSGPFFDPSRFQSRTSLDFRLQFVAKIFFGYS